MSKRQKLLDIVLTLLITWYSIHTQKKNLSLCQGELGQSYEKIIFKNGGVHKFYNISYRMHTPISKY